MDNTAPLPRMISAAYAPERTSMYREVDTTNRDDQYNDNNSTYGTRTRDYLSDNWTWLLGAVVILIIVIWFLSYIMSRKTQFRQQVQTNNKNNNNTQKPTFVPAITTTVKPTQQQQTQQQVTRPQIQQTQQPMMNQQQQQSNNQNAVQPQFISSFHNHPSYQNPGTSYYSMVEDEEDINGKTKKLHKAKTVYVYD